MLLTSIALLYSCNKNLELNLNYELTTKIDILDVVKDLKDYDNSDLFPNGTIDVTDGKVRVTFFIYDSNGVLVSENTQLVDDFSKTVTITTNVAKGVYTLVSFADIVGVANNKINTELWTIGNKESLRDLKVTKSSSNLFQYMALGITKSIITLDKSESINIKTEPAGSLVTFLFTNIDQTKVASLSYGWNRESDYYLINDQKPNIVAGVWTNEFIMQPSISKYYDQRYFLPIDQLSFAWISYSPSLTQVLSKAMTVNVQSGINKVITIDVKSGLYSESNSTKSAIILSGGDNAIRIKSLPTNINKTKD